MVLFLKFIIISYYRPTVRNIDKSFSVQSVQFSHKHLFYESFQGTNQLLHWEISIAKRLKRQPLHR